MLRIAGAAEQLTRLPFTQFWPQTDIRTVAFWFEARTLHHKDLVIMQGAVLDRIYVLAAGQVGGAQTLKILGSKP